PNADKITVDMLLNHRSGIHNFTDDENYLGYSTEPKSEEEMIAIIQKGGSDFEPNSKASYSNSNYILLTFILEKTYESSYGELLAKKVSQP
ncbi:MAG TPA: peptidase, partial [Algoriphagus sp.]|nr:peptidase [Algoriphagus sp.]